MNTRFLDTSSGLFYEELHLQNWKWTKMVFQVEILPLKVAADCLRREIKGNEIYFYVNSHLDNYILSPKLVDIRNNSTSDISKNSVNTNIATSLGLNFSLYLFSSFISSVYAIKLAPRRSSLK